MEVVLGGRRFKVGSLTERATVEHDFHVEQGSGAVVRERYDRAICQCCGFRERQGSVETCVCAGLDWYMLPGGGVECQAHRFARAVGEQKRTPFTFRRRK